MKLLLIIVSILTSFLTNLETKTLQSDFTITVSEEVNAPMNFPGQITMQGDKFRLAMMAIEAAYDGKTMYMYSGDTDELTLTNPSDQELIESNPLLFAKAISDQCTASERTTADGQQTIITLVPNDQSMGVNRFVLKVRNADLMPLQLEIKEGQANSTLRLTNPTFITTAPSFVIEPEETTFVNDLRF